MSDSQFQNPSQATPAFSPFDTFEMPTSDFVLDLPPLTNSFDAQDDDPQASSEPVRCFSVAYQDRSESAVTPPFVEAAAAETDSVEMDSVDAEDDGLTAVEPPHASDNTPDANVFAEVVSTEHLSAEASEIQETDQSVDSIHPSNDVSGASATDDTAVQEEVVVPHEVGVTVVASLDDDDEDDVDDIMLPPPIKPEALAAVVKAESTSAPVQAPPQHSAEITSPAMQPAATEAAPHAQLGSVVDHALVPDQQVACETSIVDPPVGDIAHPADTEVAVSVDAVSVDAVSVDAGGDMDTDCDVADAVAVAVTPESSAGLVADHASLLQSVEVEHAEKSVAVHESVIQNAVAAESIVEEPVVEPAVAEESVGVESVGVQSGEELAVVEPVAVKPEVSDEPVAEFLSHYAESFVAMPQVSVASEVFQDDPCATSSFQPQPDLAGHTSEPVHSEPVQSIERVQASEPVQAPPVARQPKPVSVKVSSTAPANAAAPAPVAADVRANADDAEPAEPMFRDLDLSEGVQKAVQLAGYDRPTAIQAQIIPHILEGRDVLAQSQTGTGKTAAFALPILSRLDFQQRKPQVLVLAPTRELAIQVASSFTTYGAQLPGFSVAAIYGGQDYEAQFRQLKRGVQVVVGTPGRVIDHINRGTLDLSEIQCLTLDEADEMLNMGFLEDVQFVLDHTPADRQVALFSATLPPPIRNIAQQYLKDPVRITIKQKTMTAESIRQRALFVPPRDKIDVLTRFLEAEETDGVIVFTKTKDATVTVADQLCQLGFSAIALNGDMAQKVRERTIQQLKNGQLDILVATDVAARGLDVTRVSHVFNFDVPNDSESYIHRIGRTGRAGRKGEAIIFLTNSQRHKLKIIERATRQPIEVVRVPGAEEINALRISRFQQKITETIQSQNVSIYEQMIREFAETSGQSLITIAAALAHLSQGGRPFLMTDRPVRKPAEDRERFDQPRRENDFNRDRRGSGFEERGERFDGQRNQRSRGPEDFRQLGAPEPGMDRYRIEVGRKDGVKPGNIVGAVANEGGINGDQIGPIRIHDDHSTIDLPQGMPPDVYQTLQQTVVAGRQLKLSRDHSSADRGQSRPNKRPFVPRKPAQFSHSKKRPSGAPPRGKR